MQAFEYTDLLLRHSENQRLYLEFLRVPALSLGLYVLSAGGMDPQKPHSEDEVYYVVEGRGMIHVAGEDRHVEPGSIVYVRAHDSHRFHSIEADLRILVFFAPAEYATTGETTGE